MKKKLEKKNAIWRTFFCHTVRLCSNSMMASADFTVSASNTPMPCVPSISLMMIIPAIIGYLIDQRLGTLILFTAIGLVLGMSAAIWQLVQFVAAEDKREESNEAESNREE